MKVKKRRRNAMGIPKIGLGGVIGQGAIDAAREGIKTITEAINRLPAPHTEPLSPKEAAQAVGVAAARKTEEEFIKPTRNAEIQNRSLQLTPGQLQEQNLRTAQSMMRSAGAGDYAGDFQSMRADGKVYFGELSNKAQYNSWTGNVTIDPRKSELTRDFDKEIRDVRADKNLSAASKEIKIRSIEDQRFGRDVQLAGALVHEIHHKNHGDINNKVDERGAYKREIQFYQELLKQYPDPQDSRRNIIVDAMKDVTNTAMEQNFITSKEADEWLNLK
jgi:hypothetical protein